MRFGKNKYGLLVPERRLLLMGASQQSLIASAGGSHDTNWSSVVLLCHFNGNDGDQTTTDSSTAARALTFQGTTKGTISNTQSIFGGTSYKSLAGSSTARINMSDSADFDFGSGQFTVEGWLYYTTAPANEVRTMICQWPTSSTKSWILGNSGGNIAFGYSTLGTDTNNVQGSWTPTLNTWYHIAADRDATSTLRVYVDGTVKASATVATPFFNSSNEVAIGYSTQSSNGPFLGYIDDVRVTKGVARYGGAFTRPSAEFPNN